MFSKQSIKPILLTWPATLSIHKLIVYQHVIAWCDWVSAKSNQNLNETVVSLSNSKPKMSKIVQKGIVFNVFSTFILSTNISPTNLSFQMLQWLELWTV